MLEQANGNPLARKAVLATLSISQWTARKLDKKITNEVNRQHNATEDAGRYNKLLIEKQHIERLQKVANEARTFHYSRTLPWIDNGARVLPASLYLDYSRDIGKLKAEFAAAADDFAANFPAYIEARRRDLNGMFDPNDYPHPDEVRSRFTFDVGILPCPDAADFRVDIATEHLSEIEASVEERMKQALAEAMREPVNRIMEVVGRMAERLNAYKPAPKAGGKAEGVFRDSLVENVRELVGLLPAFNLTGERWLDDIAARIERDLCQEDADTLRENEAARKTVAAQAEAILADVQAFLA